MKTDKTHMLSKSFASNFDHFSQLMFIRKQVWSFQFQEIKLPNTCWVRLTVLLSVTNLEEPILRGIEEVGVFEFTDNHRSVKTLQSTLIARGVYVCENVVRRQLLIY